MVPSCDISWNKLSATTSHLGEFLLALKQFGLRQIVLEPTRKFNILDLVWVRVDPCTKATELVSAPAGTNDHYGLKRAFTLNAPEVRIIHREKWVIKDYLISLFQDALFQTKWEDLFSNKTL